MFSELTTINSASYDVRDAINAAILTIASSDLDFTNVSEDLTTSDILKVAELILSRVPK